MASAPSAIIQTAQPLYFDSGGKQLFAWLHKPPPSRLSAYGIIICNPFGYEYICAHRSVRTFAESIANNGTPVLRFDYLGTGDSAELGANDDHTKQWICDVVAAAHELRKRMGVDRIGLLGIRLGALIATLAAFECEIIDSLILIGPIVNGRKYVRDLRMTQLAGMAMTEESSQDADAVPSDSDMLEVGGFTLPGRTVNALSQINLTTAPAPPVRSLLIVDSDKLPTAKLWSQALARSDIRVEYRALPGLIEMIITAPQFSAVPQAMLQATLDWIAMNGLSGRGRTPQAAPVTAEEGENTASPSDSSTCSPPGPSLSDPPVLLLDAATPHSSPVERPAFISTDVDLFGIITEPPSHAKRGDAVILLNPGADYHIGASRMYVSLARQWVRQGYLVLRLDIAGVGDSPTRPNHAEDEVFPAEAIEDIRAAVNYVRQRYAITQITLAGLCSGAYHALRAAAAGVDVARILMVNPQNYFWNPGMTLQQVQLVEVVHNPGLYRRRILSTKAWSRLFTGQVDVPRIASIYFRRAALSAETLMRQFARRLKLRMPDDLRRDLEGIAARGVRVVFLFARGEPGLELLKVQSGSTLAELEEHCRIRILEHGDHIFSKRRHRAVMEVALSEELYSPGPGPSGAQKC